MSITRPILLALLMILSACSNKQPEPDPAPAVHRFVRPGAVPDWAGELTEAPEELVIYALDPLPVSAEEADPTTPVFHGYRVLGSAVLSRNRDRHKLVDLLWKGIAADDGQRAACFNPRHGIRAVKGQKWADWVICFECFSLHVIDEKGEQANLGTKGFVESEFSAIYEAAGLVIDGKG